MMVSHEGTKGRKEGTKQPQLFFMALSSSSCLRVEKHSWIASLRSQ
jgi:hypothetical protein